MSLLFVSTKDLQTWLVFFHANGAWQLRRMNSSGAPGPIVPTLLRIQSLHMSLISDAYLVLDDCSSLNTTHVCNDASAQQHATLLSCSSRIALGRYPNTTSLTSTLSNYIFPVLWIRDKKMLSTLTSLSSTVKEFFSFLLRSLSEPCPSLLVSDRMGFYLYLGALLF